MTVVEEDTAPAGETTRWSVVRPSALPLRRMAVPLAAVVLAAAIMVTGLVSWWRAAGDESLDLAATRDTVLAQATKAIATMNTLDYREVDEGLAAWAGVTTGTLHDQVAQIDDDERKLVADQQKISDGKVVDAAVTTVDEAKATVVASVEVTVRDGAAPDAEPTVKRNRFSADLVLVRGTWLLERLDQVAVNVS